MLAVLIGIGPRRWFSGFVTRADRIPIEAQTMRGVGLHGAIRGSASSGLASHAKVWSRRPQDGAGGSVGENTAVRDCGGALACRHGGRGAQLAWRDGRPGRLREGPPSAECGEGLFRKNVRTSQAHGCGGVARGMAGAARRTLGENAGEFRSRGGGDTDAPPTIPCPTGRGGRTERAAPAYCAPHDHAGHQEKATARAAATNMLLETASDVPTHEIRYGERLNRKPLTESRQSGTSAADRRACRRDWRLIEFGCSLMAGPACRGMVGQSTQSATMP